MCSSQKAPSIEYHGNFRVKSRRSVFFAPVIAEQSSASNSCLPVSISCCFMTNVRSITNKLFEFDLFVDYNHPHIIALFETWLCDKIPNCLFVCSKYYTVYHCDRLSGSEGGVSLFVANDLDVNFQQISLPSQFDCLEMLAVDSNNSLSAVPFRVVTGRRTILVMTTLYFFSA
jgi:hypothetical protein